MSVFEDLIGELKEEQLLEDTVINLKNGHAPNGSGDADFSIDVDGDDYIIDDVTDVDDLTDVDEGSGTDDFFRKHATDEVATMQMVEHVLAGIERQHVGTKRPVYDDFEAKKALHRFLQNTADPSSAEYAEAEKALLEETEAWSTALSHRDEAISLAELRRFCENCRPVLSSQALIALSRFYRNCPFSEQSRQKFEYIMTRLFSREVEDKKRKLLFERPEMIGHIKNLYAKWSSISMLGASADETAIEAVLRNFAENVNRARSFDSFESLVDSDCFESLCALKESTNELFYVPEILVAAIECNIRVGNRLIDLVAGRDSYSDIKSLEELYGTTRDQAISEATGRSIDLIELLRAGAQTADGLAESKNEVRTPLFPVAAPTLVIDEPRRFASLRVNKWLLMLTVVVVAASVGLYFWANQPSAQDGSTIEAVKVDLAATDLAPYLRTGRATGTTFYAITLPAWDTLSDEQKKDVVQKTVTFAEKMRLNKVQLLNYKGRSVAFGSPEKIDLIEQ